MNLINYISFLDEADCICEDLTPVLTVVGYVIWGIKILVPIALIVIGMIKLASAIMSKDDGEIKKAQSALLTKLIVGVVVFLVPTVVMAVMNIVGDDKYKPCYDKIKNPGSLSSIFEWEPEDSNCVVTED